MALLSAQKGQTVSWSAWDHSPGWGADKNGKVWVESFDRFRSWLLFCSSSSLRKNPWRSHATAAALSEGKYGTRTRTVTGTAAPCHQRLRSRWQQSLAGTSAALLWDSPEQWQEKRKEGCPLLLVYEKHTSFRTQSGKKLFWCPVSIVFLPFESRFSFKW